MRFVTLCADDYGQDPAIDDACLQLIARGCINAVTCMTRSPRWCDSAAALKTSMAHCAVGLHFELTHDWQDQRIHFRLSSLLLRALLHMLDRNVIRASLLSQLDDFEAAVGRPPDFIDGHQHIHEFPVIRDILLSELQHRYGNLHDKLWIRSTFSHAGHRGLKGLLLQWLGRASFQQAVARAGFNVNTDFGGVYDFQPANHCYAQHMAGWMAKIQDGGVIMCHPASALVAHDSIAAARMQEFRFLASDDFTQILQREDVTLVRPLF
jgi:predicted glycoside hydrolase/deacetylase ChbG (UPF0249 family)